MADKKDKPDKAEQAAKAEQTAKSDQAAKAKREGRARQAEQKKAEADAKAAAAAPLPRVRDFRGVSDKAFDGRGNYSLGLKEHTIFPELNLDKVDKVKGLTISITTTARTDFEGLTLLRALGMPMRGASERDGAAAA